jgi:hypothetical protein
MLFTAAMGGNDGTMPRPEKSGSPVSYRPKRTGDKETILEIYEKKRIPPAEQMRMAMEALIDLYNADKAAFTPPVEMAMKLSDSQQKEARAREIEKLRPRHP